MFLKPIAIIGFLLGAFALGRSDPTLRHRAFGVAWFAAVLLQAICKLAVPHDLINRLVQRHLDTPVGSFLVIGIALIGAAGLWIPVLFIHWTALPARAWATLSMIAGAVLSAAVYYFPFDVVIMNGEVIRPKDPEYEVHFLLLLPFAVVSYAVGSLTRRRRRTAPA